MYNNWFEKEFQNFYISVNICNNLTYNGTCAEPDAIEKFLKETFFYFANQKTVVNKYEFFSHDVHQKVPN